MPKVYFKAPLAVYLVLQREGEVLLSLRQHTGFADGWYSLVAGHLEGNESVRAAAAREAKEEAGIIIRPEDMQVSGVIHRKAIFDGAEYIDFFIVPSRWKGEIYNAEPHKCAELKFFSREAFPVNTLEYVKVGIDAALKNVGFLEYGWE